MKLIDLLKQELPKRGGWPDGAAQCTQDDNGDIYFYTEGMIHYGVYRRGDWTIPGGSRARSIRKATLRLDRSDDNATTIVTREQYEAVVTQWIPEVGTECEMKHLKIDQWIPVKVTGVGEEGVILRLPSTAHEHYFRFEGRQLRPIRTEREKGIEAMLDLLNAGTQLSLADAIEQLYDAGYRKV